MSDDWTEKETPRVDEPTQPDLTFEASVPENGIKQRYFALNEKLKCLVSEYWLWIVGAVGAFVFIFGIVWTIHHFFFETHQQKVAVTGFTWERKIEVEQYTTLHEDGWYPPSDARITDSYQKIHHYDQILVGYRTDTSYYSCGTSTAPRTCSSTTQTPIYTSVPVYQRYYEYDVDRWVTSRWIVTSGTDQKPFWNDLSGETFNLSNVLGNEREGNDHPELYVVHFETDKGKAYKKEVNLQRYLLTYEGERVILNLNRQDAIRSVNWPKGNAG